MPFPWTSNLLPVAKTTCEITLTTLGNASVRPRVGRVGGAESKNNNIHGEIGGQPCTILCKTSHGIDPLVRLEAKLFHYQVHTNDIINFGS
jgi:hypothetical protein